MGSSKDKRIGIKGNPKYCCGCEVCESVCPVGAITMKQNDEGFFMPYVNTNTCVNCGKCTACCPEINVPKKINDYEIPMAYGVKHKNEDVRENSRSGGIFTAISDYILNNGGIVYGSVLDSDFIVRHKRADSIADRNLMRGSKYVQSRMDGICKSVINDLKDGRTVLFSGTPCQVMGIRKAVPIEFRDRLLLMDIVCHGVPSPLIYEEYINYIENKYGNKPDTFDFRDKKQFGWKDHVETMHIGEEKYASKEYTNIFYNHVSVRNSCYNCLFKSLVRPGDISIGDFWGIDKAIPGFNDNKGVSLVLINNDRGQQYFDIVKSEIESTKVDNLNLIMQPPLKGNFIVPSRRKKFWNLYRKEGFEAVVQIYGKRLKVSYIDRIKNKALRIRYKLLKNN